VIEPLEEPPELELPELIEPPDEPELPELEDPPVLEPAAYVMPMVRINTINIMYNFVIVFKVHLRRL